MEQHFGKLFSHPFRASAANPPLALPSNQQAVHSLGLYTLGFRQPQAHHLLAAGGALTSGVWPAEDWPLDNRVSATVRLQAAGTPQELLPRLLQEAARFPGRGNEAFRRALHSWARALWEHKAERPG